MPSESLTIEQFRQLLEDLAGMQTQATGIKTLLSVVYGEMDDRATRAGEVEAALKRLEWALDRGKGASDSASA